MQFHLLYKCLDILFPTFIIYIGIGESWVIVLLVQLSCANDTGSTKKKKRRQFLIYLLKYFESANLSETET